jgi:hypothetical protein
LTAHGVEWQNAIHVCSSGAFAGHLLRTNVTAVHIVPLIDLFVFPQMPAEVALSRAHFPTHNEGGSHTEYAEAMSRWVSMTQGRKIRMRVRANNLLRSLARTSGARHHHTIYQARYSFIETLERLVREGFTPDDVMSTGGLTAAAVDVWRHIEAEIPGFTTVRDVLWNHKDSANQPNTNATHAQPGELLATIRHVRHDHVPAQTLVFHGFHYHHPQHWAFIQLLAEQPELTVIIVVHSDGKNPALSGVLQFYTAELGWPKPTIYPVDETPTPAAAVLLNALHGIRIDPESADLQIQMSHTPADFVGHINMARTLIRVDPDAGVTEIPRLYAADSYTINRYFERLDIANPSRHTDLSKLPIGIFLLRLHECITIDPSDRTRSIITLSTNSVTDIIASNYLVVDGAQTVQWLGAWTAAAGFFQDCLSPDEWSARAVSLCSLLARIHQPGAPTTNPLQDLARIDRAARSFIRLVPWADISPSAGEMIARIINEIISVLTRLTHREAIHLREHHMFLLAELSRSMQHIPATEYQAIQEKLTGYGVGMDEEVFVEGLFDIVSMLLSRSVDFDNDESEEYQGRFSAIRHLEMLGLERTTHPIHLANLAEGIFPAANAISYWPFGLDGMNTQRNAVSATINALRRETAHLSDLYMLWLALDGVEQNTITLSWIAAVAGEKRNRSTLLDLIGYPNPTASNHAYCAAVGGIPITPAPVQPHMFDQIPAPTPEVITADHVEQYTAYRYFHRHAAATVMLCQRRFALQWVLGRSIAHTQEHIVNMLYGNLRGIAEIGNEAITEDLIEALWPQLSNGEKASSYAKKRIRRGGANPVWLYTLSGSRDRKSEDAFSRTYQTLVYRHPVVAHPIPVGTFLPPGVNEYARGHCDRCPVKSRCAVARM